MDLKEMAEKALDHFGYESQISKAIEELCELGAALARHQNDNGMMLDIVEEIADCMIMLAQMRLLFDANLIDSKIQQKLKRLEHLIHETPPFVKHHVV